MVQGPVEVVELLLLPQQRLQRGQGVLDRPDQTEINRGAAAEMAATDVYLDDPRVVGIELLVRKSVPSISSASASLIALYPEANPSRPVMPTS